MFEYPQRRLEASAWSQLRHPWAHLPFHRAKPKRPAQPRGRQAHEGKPKWFRPASEENTKGRTFRRSQLPKDDMIYLACVLSR